MGLDPELITEVEKWIRNTFCPISQSVCTKLYNLNPAEDFDNITEKTIPNIGDITSDNRTVVHVIGEAVGLDDGTVCMYDDIDCNVHCSQGYFPMWGTMWYFRPACFTSDYEDLRIHVLSQCGFKVYRSEDLGIVFGIDAAGTDFYEPYWIPLYKKFQENDM